MHRRHISPPAPRDVAAARARRARCCGLRQLLQLELVLEHTRGHSPRRGRCDRARRRRRQRGAGAARRGQPRRPAEIRHDLADAKAGTVTIGFTNTASIAHNLTIESSSGSQVGATPTFEGGTKTLTLSLKPGTYKFFCTVPGHRQAGMEGTLTVQ